MPSSIISLMAVRAPGLGLKDRKKPGTPNCFTTSERCAFGKFSSSSKWRRSRTTLSSKSGWPARHAAMNAESKSTSVLSMSTSTRHLDVAALSAPCLGALSALKHCAMAAEYFLSISPILNCCSTRLRPIAPMVWRSSADFTKRSSRVQYVATSPASIRKPSALSVQHSGMPAMRLQITGRSNAIASQMTSGRTSFKLGHTTMSLA
mmetsp:Transcript_31567/g.79165  ORF Transcript_31567/g.79165 Transcript_31567/m.79165 type:complete len:206 (+) Transcript_31567:818-1435(+)